MSPTVDDHPGATLMTFTSPAAFAASGRPVPAAPLGNVTPDYRPGVCNIGPAEIARRRRSGHVGVITAVILFGVLVVIDAPPLARFLVAAPATQSTTQPACGVQFDVFDGGADAGFGGRG